MSQPNESSSSLQVPNQTQKESDTQYDVPMLDIPITDTTIKGEKTMGEFLASMDNYAPIIPDALATYYLQKAGFDCDDVRIKRLIALAAQKYIADIATDAFQYCKVRQSGNKKLGKDRKSVLTMEDLTAALTEYGVNVKKPEYYS